MIFVNNKLRLMSGI